MIIDFRVETQDGGYIKKYIVERVKGGNTEYNYAGLMRTAENLKLNVIREAMADWNLLENMNRAKQKVDELVRESGGTITFEGDLERYVHDIKETVAFLKKS